MPTEADAPPPAIGEPVVSAQRTSPERGARIASSDDGSAVAAVSSSGSPVSFDAQATASPVSAQGSTFIAGAPLGLRRRYQRLARSSPDDSAGAPSGAAGRPAPRPPSRAARGTANNNPLVALTATDECAAEERGIDDGSRRPGRHALFGDYYDVGVEGAAAAQATRRGAPQREEMLLGIQLPLATVLAVLQRKQRLLVNLREAVFFAPLFTVFLLFVFVGPSSPAHVELTADELRQVGRLNSLWLGGMEQQLLLDVFREDTEVMSSSASGDFIAGVSEQFASLYSFYNTTVNAWTTQAGDVIPPSNALSDNASAGAATCSALDAQEARVAQSRSSVSAVRLDAIRSKRELMQWLLGSFINSLWDCDNDDVASSWQCTRRGSLRFIGSVLLTATRQRPTKKQQRTMTAGWCRRRSLRHMAGIPCSAAYATAEEEEEEQQSSSRAGGSNGTAVCNVTNPALSSEVLFAVERTQKNSVTYAMHLPFAASCSSVRAALKLLSTSVQPDEETISFEELWARYSLSTSPANSSSCESFIFDPRTTEFAVRYVVYAAEVNHFFLVALRFRMAAAGSVVVPELRVASAPALSWRYNFTSLAMSIAVAVCLVLYGQHVVCAYRAVFASKRRSWDHSGWGAAATGFLAAMETFVRVSALVHFTALALVVAALTVFWWSWGEVSAQLSKDKPLDFSKQARYPRGIAYLCEHTASLQTRMLAAASYFMFLCAVRLASGVAAGLSSAIATIGGATERLLPLLLGWMGLEVAFTIMATCFYGSSPTESFSDFSRSFLSLLVLYIDRGKNYWRDEEPRYGFDPMLPSVYGSLLQHDGRSAGNAQSYRWSSMQSAAGRRGHNFFVFLLILVQILMFAAVATAVLADGFFRVIVHCPAALCRGGGLLEHVPNAQLTMAGLRRRLRSRAYLRERLSRLLWARAGGAVLEEVHEKLQLALPVHASTNYAGMLWLLPRSLQAELGMEQLRLWWMDWAEEAASQQRARRAWEQRQWLRHWDRGASGLRGWLRRVVPDAGTLEARATQLTSALEDLPVKVARHAEGVARR